MSNYKTNADTDYTGPAETRATYGSKSSSGGWILGGLAILAAIAIATWFANSDVTVQPTTPTATTEQPAPTQSAPAEPAPAVPAAPADPAAPATPATPPASGSGNSTTTQ